MKKKSIIDFIPKPKTKFLRVKCAGCGNEQTIFSAASTKVRCLVCNKDLAETTGSKIVPKTTVLKVYE